MRFRLPKIAITADIEKAFLMIGLHEGDRDAVRFLWLKNPEKGYEPANIETFRFKRVPFGLICSPFLLGAAVQNHIMEVTVQHPEWKELKSNQLNLNQLKLNLYVDNVLMTAATPEDAQNIYYMLVLAK